MKSLAITTLSAGLLLGLSAQGAITYVDAQEGGAGNTYATGGSLGDTSWIDTTDNGGTYSDSVWELRFGGTPGWTQHNGGDVIEAQVSTSFDHPQLTTEITGLADGTYDVWVFFWNQVTSATQDWVIDAGLTSGALSAYSDPGDPVAGTDSTTPVNAASLSFTNSPAVVAAGGNQNMIGVNLGEVTVSGGSAINVYIDKLTGTGSATRTVYDGVGYELVPEPSSLALLSLGGLFFARRRRAA